MFIGPHCGSGWIFNPLDPKAGMSKAKQRQTWRGMYVRWPRAFNSVRQGREKGGRYDFGQHTLTVSSAQLLVTVYGCALPSRRYSAPQTLTIDHTCWSLPRRHQTPCRHTRLTPRIPTEAGGGPARLPPTHTVARGERHFPDRCPHFREAATLLYSHSATSLLTHVDRNLPCVWEPLEGPQRRYGRLIQASREDAQYELN